MKQARWLWPAGIGLPIFVAGLLGSTAADTSAQGGPPPLGGPLPGLTPQENQRFQAGRNEFLQNETPQSGLGPVFNGVSCVQCHNAGAPGGASNNNQGVSVVTRIAAIVNGQYSDLEDVGGSLIQARSLREILGPQYPVGREIVPPQAQFVARRITTPVFGMGWIEAIPAATILSRSGVPQGGGVQGVANMVVNPETNAIEVGRFGWKAQVSTIHVFAADAYLNEMGITNPTFPEEVRPQGQPLPPGSDPAADPESNGQAVNALADFMRFVDRPLPLPPTVDSERGRTLFTKIGCAACHVPSMTTGPSPSAAIAFKVAELYSDLLLHRMGPKLADGIRQGQAEGDQFRTPPLWGLRFRPVLMHDGRATSIDQAIRAHGGEASKSAGEYVRLSRTERSQLLEFLSRL